MVPRPWHSGQVENVAPGAPPLPPQVGHTCGIRSVTGTLPPSAATRNGIETVVSISSSSRDAAPPAAPPHRRPKIDENRSPSPPNEPRSERSKSTPEPSDWPPPQPNGRPHDAPKYELTRCTLSHLPRLA